MRYVRFMSAFEVFQLPGVTLGSVQVQLLGSLIIVTGFVTVWQAVDEIKKAQTYHCIRFKLSDRVWIQT